MADDDNNPWRGLPRPQGRNDDPDEGKSETTSPGSISSGTGGEGEAASQEVLFAISEAAKAATRTRSRSVRDLRPPHPRASWREGWSSAPAAVPITIPGAVGARTSQGRSTRVSHGSGGMDSGPSTEAPERPSSSRFRFSAEAEGAGFYEEDEFFASAGLRRDESECPPRIMDLREAIRSGCVANLEASLKRRSIRQELMAKNAANGAGPLMLAVSMGRVPVFERLAVAVKQRLGTTQLARQLRYEDDEEKPLIFYATASSLAMFQAVKKLIKETIGVAGLAEQLRHQCSQGTNVLMRACGDPEVFREVWALVERTRCLRELMDENDKDGKSWVLYAAEAGNPALFDKIRVISEDVYTLFNKADKRGWNGFMYTVRRRTSNLNFLKKVCAECFASRVDAAKLEEQLTRIANDDDRSTLLMHASIGGRKAYNFVCSMMSEIEYAGNPDQHDKNLAMLCWAAQGGDIAVLNMVAEGIKTRVYPGGTARRRWFDANYHSAQEADTLLNAILTYPERPGTSLFLSAVESRTPAMIKTVAEGIKQLVPDPKVRWTVLCGIEGNPLVAAASTTIECFVDTIHTLQGVAESDKSGELKRELMGLFLPTKNTEVTPLVSAVYTEEPELFTAVLKEVDGHATRSEGGWLSGETIIEQMGHAMRDVNKEEQLAEKWISAKMLAHVLQAAKTAGKDSTDGYFDVSMLDGFVRRSVQLGAFDHIRELVNIGCNLANHFPSLLSKIGTYEMNTIDCMMLAITTASNPFVVCGMASKSIYEATIKRQMHSAPLGRLQQRIMELTLELLEHLPHSVNGVGEELARGDLDLEPFYGVAKVVPSELLGYVVVEGGENSLVQAVRSGPRSLEFLSEALVLDYLGLKFSRTLPRWHSQKPFERNINQAFYSYTHQARKAPTDAPKEDSDFFQTLLLVLQGWRIQHMAIPHRTILPGLQFTLAGIMGKPVSYYIVPSIRMAFVVISYLATIGLYLSCVSLTSQHVPPNEWIFYVFMLAVAWREVLEFSNASKLEPGVGASIDRYFYDKWNFLDVTTVLFVFLAFMFRMLELATGNVQQLILAQCFLASTAPLLFSRVLFLSQIGSALGPMTQVIFTMMTELVQFSLVLLLVMLGFAASFSALYDTNTVLVEQLDPSCDVRDHPVVMAFGEIGDSLLTIFAAMLGEFDFSVFYERYENGDGLDCGGVMHIEAGVALMVIYLVIMAVMLLNLLIAVLSTAHAEVQQNASKEFQLARAKIIIQSGEDVLNDVLPPPFNLLKPVLGAVWPVGSRHREQWDRLWEITMGALNRTIFSFVVGLAALALLNVMWALSFPLITWKISVWLSTVPLKRQEEERQADKESTARAHASLEHPARRLAHQQRWSCLTPKGVKIHGKDDEVNFPSWRESRHLYLQPSSMKGEDIKDSVERIFFLGSSEGKGRLSTAHAAFLLGSLVYLLVGALLAAVLCFLVYPLLSIVLWTRGLGTVLRYIDQSRSKDTPWERRQLDLDEQEEWSLARAHAIKRNRRYSTANSSETEFNVDALLKTTTGMTLDDLGHSMRNFKSTRKKRALGASLDIALSQFPSEDRHS